MNIEGPLILLLLANCDSDLSSLQGILTKLMWTLAIVQLPIVAYQSVMLLPYNKDAVTGTFGAQSAQLAAFLVPFAAYNLAMMLMDKITLRRLFITAALVSSILFTFYTIGTVAMLVALGLVIAIVGSQRQMMYAVVIPIALSMILWITIPNTVLFQVRYIQNQINVILEAIHRPGWYYISGKLSLARSLPRILTADNHGLLVGTGPGTCASRAFMTTVQYAIEAHPGAGYLAAADSKTNVGRFFSSRHYTNDIKERFIDDIVPGQLDNPHSPPLLLSHALADIQSSYMAQLLEVGMLGFIIYWAIYIKVGRFAWRVARFRGASVPVRAWASATVAHLSFLCITAVFTDSFAISRYVVPFWTTVGILWLHMYKDLSVRWSLSNS